MFYYSREADPVGISNVKGAFFVKNGIMSITAYVPACTQIVNWLLDDRLYRKLEQVARMKM